MFRCYKQRNDCKYARFFSFVRCFNIYIHWCTYDTLSNKVFNYCIYTISFLTLCFWITSAIAIYAASGLSIPLPSPQQDQVFPSFYYGAAAAVPYEKRQSSNEPDALALSLAMALRKTIMYGSPLFNDPNTTAADKEAAFNSYKTVTEECFPKISQAYKENDIAAAAEAANSTKRKKE